MSKKLFSLFVGFSFCLILTLQVHSQEQKLAIEQKTDTILCTANGKPLFVYRVSPSSSYEQLPEKEYKTYISELYTPEGRNILRDSPWDHVHHHALMFAIAADDVNFWEEHGKDNAGVQFERSTFASQTEQFMQNVNGSEQWTSKAGILRQVDWYKPDKTVVIQEDRSIRAILASDDDVTLLTWTSTLAVGGRESVKLSGSHYYGLGMRFDETMDKNGTFFCDADSTIANDNVRGDEKKTPCKWMAYTAELHGKPVTVAVFDAPGNPRPMSAFTMGESGQSFAYISATVDLEKEPITLEKGKPLTFEYGVAVWEGKKSTDDVQNAWCFWLENRKP